MSQPIRIRKSLSRFSEYQKNIIELFTETFLPDDPLINRLIPNIRRRRRFLKHYFAYRLKFAILYGEAYVTSPEIEGGALWVRHARRSLWKNARAGGLTFYLTVGGRMIVRLMRIANFIDSLHNKHISSDHYQLERIAVRSDARGKGHMGALLNPMLAKIDSMNLPCSLETENESNVALYAHYGFEVVAQSIIPWLDLPHWLMIRYPQS